MGGVLLNFASKMHKFINFETKIVQNYCLYYENFVILQSLTERGLRVEPARG